MTDVFAVSAAAVVLVMIITAIKRTEPGVGGVLSVFLTVWLSYIAVELIINLREGFSLAGDNGVREFLPYVFKAAGIGFLTQTTADVCADMGEGSVGSKIVMMGKLGILTVCLPLIKHILEAALGYIK